MRGAIIGLGSSRMSLDLAKESKKYRYGLEIARDMLLIASVRARKTRIMYAANLSYHQSEKYLKNLLENGLLECQGDYYIITRRGKDFLQMYENYLERSKRIDDDINGVRKNRLILENMCFNVEGNLKRPRIRKSLSMQRNVRSKSTEQRFET